MEPIKPALHVDRHYRYIELQNEIGVLLISDTTVKTAGAALDIAIGSFNDPEDVQGLAHFLGMFTLALLCPFLPIYPFLILQ